MKKFISLALILVLTLICGVQIAADSAETYAMCRHPHSTYVIAGYSVDRVDGCEVYRDTYDCEQCTVCNALLSVGDYVCTSFVGYRHEAERGIDGTYHCRYCWCKM